MNFTANLQIDVTQETTEQALLQVEKQLENINQGQVLAIIASDKKFAKELKGLANKMRQSYFKDEDAENRHYIRKETTIEKSDSMEQNYIMSLQAFTKKYQENDDIYILDVREDFEYEQGHVPGSVFIPLGKLEGNLQRIPKDREIHVICRTGNRSDFAARILMEYGYQDVFNIVPGMIAWDGPVETGIE